jgi:hypothetical protein
MPKTLQRDAKSADSFASSSSRRFLRASLAILLPLLIIVLIAAFPWLYEIKTKAGIDLVPGIHAGSFLEKYSHGLVKCEWLYPYDCSEHPVGAVGSNMG